MSKTTIGHMLLYRHNKLGNGAKVDTMYANYPRIKMYYGVLVRTNRRIFNGVPVSDYGINDNHKSKISEIFEVNPNHTYLYNYDDRGWNPAAAESNKPGNVDATIRSRAGYDSIGAGLWSAGQSSGGQVQQSVRPASLDRNTQYMCVSTTFNLDNFYIYDQTVETFIYRGKNVNEDLTLKDD